MPASRGGSLDQIQIDLIINTIAQTQGIRQFSSELEHLGRFATPLRDKFGRFTAGIPEQFAELNKVGRDLSQTLIEGFGPRFISSTGQANSALIRIGGTLSLFTAKATE